MIIIVNFFYRAVDSPVSRSPPIDKNSIGIVENRLYEAIPPKGKTLSAVNSSMIKLE